MHHQVYIYSILQIFLVISWFQHELEEIYTLINSYSMNRSNKNASCILFWCIGVVMRWFCEVCCKSMHAPPLGLVCVFFECLFSLIVSTNSTNFFNLFFLFWFPIVWLNLYQLHHIYEVNIYYFFLCFVYFTDNLNKLNLLNACSKLFSAK